MQKQIRKRIAVLMADLQSEYHRRTISGIIQQAHALQDDVLTFTIFSNRDVDTPFQVGEENIFQLIPWQEIDGLIVLSHSFCKPSLRKMVTDFCRQSNLPYLLDAEDEWSDETKLFWNDRRSFQMLVQHLIEVHGHRKIACLTGLPSCFQSEERLLGYRDALQAHGIPLRPEWECYGDFQRASGQAFANRIVQGELERPDAIACANAAMALGVIDTLMQHGISVPEDLAVVSYDSYSANAIHTPSVTAMSDENFNYGVSCMCRLYQKMTGTACTSIPLHPIQLELGESCGCNDVDSKLMQWYKNMLQQQQYHLDLLQNCNMAQALSSQETLTDFLRTLDSFRYVIQGVEDVYICINEDWENSSNLEGSVYRVHGYAEMIYVHRLDVGHALEQDSFFPTSALIPALQEQAAPSCFYFLPLHFADRCFGYLAVSFKKEQIAFDKLFRIWVEHVSTALEAMRRRNDMQRLQRRMYLTAIRDPLTGLYNRKGMEELSEELYKQAMIQQEKLLIVAVDLDDLKGWNLQYGYEEGDRAILTIADALRHCCRRNEICCRCGEDHYYLIGCMAYTEEILAEYHSILMKICARHLLKDGTPAALPISYGLFCAVPTKAGSLPQAFALAQEQLRQYRQKKGRKTVYYKNLTELREKIYQQPQKKWTVQQMADAMLLSQGYFQRLYKKEFGVSAMSDVIAARIVYAQQLLRESHASVQKIAERCGYENEIYFMQQFKKETGLTPTQYRRKYFFSR